MLGWNRYGNFSFEWTRNDCMKYALVRSIVTEWRWKIKTFHSRRNNYRSLSDVMTKNVLKSRGDLFFPRNANTFSILQWRTMRWEELATSGGSFLMVLYKTEKIPGTQYNGAGSGVCTEQD